MPVGVTRTSFLGEKTNRYNLLAKKLQLGLCVLICPAYYAAKALARKLYSSSLWFNLYIT